MADRVPKDEKLDEIQDRIDDQRRNVDDMEGKDEEPLFTEAGKHNEMTDDQIVPPG